jgi:hypothetical protein
MSAPEPQAEADINLNQANVYNNKELYDALAAARMGDDSGANGLLLTEMLAGLNFNAGVTGYGTIGSVVNGVYQTGGMHLRRNATFNTNLVNGNFLAIANSLATAISAAVLSQQRRCRHSLAAAYCGTAAIESPRPDPRISLWVRVL